jgi:cobalt/nickel transport system ATP-binding protein
MPEIAALRLTDVSVRYDQSEADAIENLSLEIQPGQRMALLGLNGAGKTTVLSIPVGLVPHSGHAEVSGIPVEKKHLAEIRRKVGVLFSVPDDQILFPRVLDDVMFGLKKRGVARDQAEQQARKTLDLMGIPDLADSSPHRLSHGQKLRVALAGALVIEPDLLLLDEPAGALDPIGQKQLAEHLTTLPTAMLIASHNLPFTRSACTHYVVIHQGRLQGPPKPTTELPADPEQLWQQPH